MHSLQCVLNFQSDHAQQRSRGQVKARASESRPWRHFITLYSDIYILRFSTENWAKICLKMCIVLEKKLWNYRSVTGSAPKKPAGLQRLETPPQDSRDVTLTYW